MRTIQPNVLEVDVRNCRIALSSAFNARAIRKLVKHTVSVGYVAHVIIPSVIHAHILNVSSWVSSNELVESASTLLTSSQW